MAIKTVCLCLWVCKGACLCVFHRQLTACQQYKTVTLEAVCPLILSCHPAVLQCHRSTSHLLSGTVWRCESPVLLVLMRTSISWQYFVIWGFCLYFCFTMSTFWDFSACIFTCVSYAEARLSYRLDVCLSVCPSVCLSQAGIVSKRLNILSCFLHHTIAHSF